MLEGADSAPPRSIRVKHATKWLRGKPGQYIGFGWPRQRPYPHIKWATAATFFDSKSKVTDHNLPCKLPSHVGLSSPGFVLVPTTSNPSLVTHQHSPDTGWHWVELYSPVAVHVGINWVSGAGPFAILRRCSWHLVSLSEIKAKMWHVVYL